MGRLFLYLKEEENMMGRFISIGDEGYLIDPSKVTAFSKPRHEVFKILGFKLDECRSIDILVEGKAISVSFSIEETALNWYKIMLRDW